MLGCLIQPDLRIDIWNQQAQAVVEEFRSELPDGIGSEVLLEQNQFVMKRLKTLLFNLALGAGAVTLVIFLMMGWRSAIVVGLALPLAAMMVLGGLRLMEIPLHQMSITGLIIALGLLIDNAIVVVDETRSNMRKGFSASKAIRTTVSAPGDTLIRFNFYDGTCFRPVGVDARSLPANL